MAYSPMRDLGSCTGLQHHSYQSSTAEGVFVPLTTNLATARDDLLSLGAAAVQWHTYEV
jgi:hypothetical protein